MDNIIGKKIKSLRLKSGITQKELAAHLECTEVMVSRYELGVSQISIPQLMKIAKVLQTPASSFFEDTEGSTNGTTHKNTGIKKAFVFDIDDTLVDARQFCGETIARVITSKYPTVNFNLVCQLHDNIKGQTIFDIYTNILKELDIKADVPELLKQDFTIQQKNIHRLQLFDGVVDILEFLKSNGKKLYICTNRTKNLMLPLLEHNNILGYFDEIISCADAGFKKPNPLCLTEIINKSGIDPSEFIYFGDSEVDTQFAQNANIDFMVFDQYLNNKNLFKKLVNMFLEKQINGFH
ncbi:HAD-IA family hydrolase [Candidatus Shapirobacteria bacterium]|nr:HAD-IA family hydrolase [Candidatus Shapirobacteria bacterium]